MVAKLKEWIDAFPLPNELICLGIGVALGLLACGLGYVLTA